VRPRIDELRQKYLTVFEVAPKLGIRVLAAEMHHAKLRIIGVAPSEEMKKRLWDQITTVDPTYPDLICEISVNPTLPS
jgi:hypothetical protein